MANCTYRFTDQDGKERVIKGQAAFKAYLVDGGLKHLLPGPKVAFSAKQAETPEFKRWFGDSKVVDAEGKPLVVYHGTDSDFSTFDIEKSGASNRFGPGFYFTGDKRTFDTYGGKEGGNVMPVYLSMNNPQVGSALTEKQIKSFFAALRDKVFPNGYDATADHQKFEQRALDKPEKAFDTLLSAQTGYISKEDWLRGMKAIGVDGIVRDVFGHPEYVVFSPTQIKSATGNTGAFDVTNPDIRFSGKQQPEFFSQLSRVMAQVPDRLSTMPAPQWKAWLDSNSAKLGVKKDEIEWSGIKDYLDLRGKDKVTRADLVAYLGENGVKVDEVKLEERLKPGTVDDLLQEWADTQKPDNPIAKAISYGESYDSIRRLLKDTPEPAVQALLDRYQAKPVQYGKYTLPGGENYREVLLTLPQKADQISEPTGEVVEDGKDEAFPFAIMVNGREENRVRIRASANDVLEEELDRARAKARKAAEAKTTFQSSHWDPKNVLAHIRVNDRTDADGKKVLFVEEVQSDWGQEGKKRGFRQPVDREAIESRVQNITARFREIAKSGVDESPELQAEWTRLSEEKSQLTESLVRSNSGIPVAPFVTKTEGWLNLALKRIAMMAVEGGYDKVAFVNGEQSADRYDLSKTVDEITYEPTAKGFYINVMANGGNIKQGDFTPADLEDIVGKEIVEKMQAREGENVFDPKIEPDLADTRRLKGEGLKVGGKGMIKFYGDASDPFAPVGKDKLGKPIYAVLPQALNSLLPKIGGEKMGSIQFGQGKNTGGGFVVFDEDSGEELFRTSNRREANEYRLAYPGDAVVQEYAGSTEAVIGAQPGFDVTDAMRETVGQGLPMFSRKQVGKETEGWIFSRDELGRFRFGAGAKAYRYAADVANAVLAKVNLAPVTPELSRALRKMKMEIEKAQNLTVDVAKNLKDLPKQEREMISDIIEGELKRGAKPPQHILDLAASMQSIMSEQTAELVSLGMLSPEAAGRWDGKYLPRFYEQKLGEETKAWMKAAKGVLGRKRTMQGITGNSLKARGMFQNVPVEDLADWEAEGWEKRDPDFDPAVDTEITVWRDYTRKERDDKGEIRDAMFRFVMGYNKSQRDISLGRLYESLATTVGSRTEQPGYVKVPDTKVEDTFVPRYGKLANKWVPKEVLDQLSLFDTSMQNDLTKMYLKGLSMWKEGKTVLNPVAHANNVLSNLTMAHFAGVSYWDAHKYIGATRDLVKGGAMVDEAAEAGLFGGTFNREDFLAVMPEELKAMAQITESAIGRNVDRVWNTLSLFLRKPMGAAYQAEDTFFRYLIYRDARNRGLGVDDSVDYAQKYIFTYDDLPKTARVIRDMPLGLPFFGYTYKAIPALANTALEHPARYAAPAVAIYVANAAMYAMAASLGGGDDEDWWTVIRRYMTDPEFRQRAKDMEQQERKNLPEWNKGASLSLGTEKTIRLGMDDLTHLPVFLDVSRIFPGGDLFDAHNNAGGIPLLAPITPNNPILTTAAAILYNKDTFRNKPVTDATDTDAEAAQKRAMWMWKQVTPAIAFGNTHFERAMNVIANVTGQPVNVGLAEYTGIGSDGLPIQPAYAAMQTVGIKARPIDLDTSEKIQQSQTKAMMRDLETSIKKLNRLENKGAITPEGAEKEREKLRQKKQFLREGLTVEGEEKD